MREIQLTQGKVAIVDDDDYEGLSIHRWYAAKYGRNWYALRSGSDGKVYMHRHILGLRKGDPLEVDHKNRESLDNRRENLRACTRQQNTRNRRGRKNTSSKHKGVAWKKGESRGGGQDM